MPGNESNSSKLDIALSLTREVFREVERYPILVQGQNIAFAIYSVFHHQIAIPWVLKNETGSGGSREAWAGHLDTLARKHGSRSRDLISRIRNKLRHLVPFAYSVISMMWLSTIRKPKVALWTGDFLDRETKSDFRLGNLCERMGSSRIFWFEMIRTNHQGFRSFWKNLVNRRRPALYYDSIAEYVGWILQPPSIPSPLGTLGSVYRLYHRDLVAIARSIPVLAFIMKLLNVKGFVAWEYSIRQAALMHAARCLKIPTLGFMHGAGMINYMAHEFIPEHTGNPCIGPDVFGVWSDWWAKYYAEHTRLYGKIEVSGSLRKGRTLPIVSNAQTGIRRVLWISEPLAEVDEVLPYIRQLLDRYEIAIKKRPLTSDAFYNRLIQIAPELGKLPTESGDIFEAMQGYDLVLGSHSTAVLEAACLDKPFILVNTNKWGDYFQLSDAGGRSRFFSESPSDLLRLIADWENADVKALCGEVRLRFFGRSEDSGCDWIINKIKGVEPWSRM